MQRRRTLHVLVDDGNYANKVGAKCNYALLDKCALSGYYPDIAQAFVNSSQLKEESEAPPIIETNAMKPLFKL